MNTLNYWNKAIFGLLVKKECMCTPHEYKNMKYQYKLWSDRACRMLRWYQSILRISEFGARNYVIVYPSIVHYVKYISCPLFCFKNFITE